MYHHDWWHGLTAEQVFDLTRAVRRDHLTSEGVMSYGVHTVEEIGWTFDQGNGWYRTTW